MSRIYLIGFMGAGKSTIGKKLARLFDYNWYDLDDAFEEKYKINIRSFFHKYDEALFRKLEKKMLAETFKMKDTVISTGGGTPAFFNSISEMNKHGLTVYLKMSEQVLAKRLKQAKRPRPLLKSIGNDSITNFIRKKLEEREPFYNQAHLVVDTDNADIKYLSTLIKSKL